MNAPCNTHRIPLAEVWFHACSAVPEARRATLLAALAAQGLAVEPLRQVPAAGPGLLLFDAVDAALLDMLRDLGPAARALAVHAGAEPLPAAQHWRLLDAGAADVLDGPQQGPCPAPAIAARLQRWATVESLLDAPLVRDNLVGASPAWRRLLREVIDYARHAEAGALVVGESGCGKELIARLIHTLDPRRDKGELVVLDCSTVAGDLAGSEFFGHERGAFTGAVGAREGAFALADGGTLFLDEIGELPMALQPRLLRVVQERSYKRLGSNRWERTDFRLVCATHRDLAAEVAGGSFRADLYWRIAGAVFEVPPLRRRSEDIVPLARHFLAQARSGRPVPALQDAVLEHLQQRDYPGNVRELRQLVGRIAARHVGDGPISVGDLPAGDRPTDPEHPEPWQGEEFEAAIRRALDRGAGLRDIGQGAAEAAIRIALDQSGGNLQRAAARLGVTDRALQMRRAARPWAG